MLLIVYVSVFDQAQTALFPFTVDEMIDENNEVRLVGLYINGIELP